MSETKRIGLFFGSFNPVHTGHLIIAQAMADNAGLNKIWFVVSPQNPFKPSKSLLHEFDRFDMVQAAIADNHQFAVTDVEFHLPRPSYTVDTLEHLAVKYPDHEFSLILGEDNLEGFMRWKDPEKILARHQLLVYPRPGAPATDLHRHPAVTMVAAPLIEISATYIRQCVLENRSIRYLVPEVVISMIDKKGFYLA
ncbi:MAG: nicotinate (nicotinamide) nucleotide adenylyltransferase [Bacteroidota bacterium]